MQRRRTHARRCSPSFNQAKIQFLKEMQKNGLVEKHRDTDDNTTYMASESGRRFLCCFRAMIGITKGLEYKHLNSTSLQER